MTNITIETDPEQTSVWGRHNTPIRGIHLWGDKEVVFLDGVGVRGQPLANSGFHMLPVNAMNQLALQWLVDQKLMTQATANGLLRQALLNRDWVGQRIKVTEGEFKGRQGRVESVHVNGDDEVLWILLHSNGQGTQYISLDPVAAELIV